MQLPVSKKHKANYFVDNWSEDQQYLTTDVPVLSQTQMNLGWHVIIRQPMSIALAEVKSLQHKILAICFILSLLLLLLTYKLANRFSRPIETLAQSAHAVERGKKIFASKPRPVFAKLKVCHILYKA